MVLDILRVDARLEKVAHVAERVPGIAVGPDSLAKCVACAEIVAVEYAAASLVEGAVVVVGAIRVRGVTHKNDGHNYKGVNKTEGEMD